MMFEHIFLSGLRTNVGLNRNSLLIVVKLNLISLAFQFSHTHCEPTGYSDWESISANRIFRTVRSFKERVQKEILYVIT